MPKKIREFDLGAEDARNLPLLSVQEKKLFLDSYVVPEVLDLGRFYDGRKHFVFGGKGSGKTALLQYLRINSEVDLNAITSFYYFQSTFSESELRRFRNVVSGRTSEEIVNDTVFQADEDASIFWRIFILDQILKLLRRARVQGKAFEDFSKALEAAKLISKSSQNRKKYPSLESFQVRLAKDPHVQIDGTFNEAGSEDLVIYLDIAESALEDVYLEGSPIFLFIDEMEIYRRGDHGDEIQVAAISSLIRAIRDFGERFPDSGVRIIAAIRREIVDEVAEVKYEVHRIVRDKGIELDWPKTVKKGYHPLEKTILNRFAVQDEEIDCSNGVSDNELNIAASKYFEGVYPGKKLIDMTWYRPRDMALLFEIAQTFDGGRAKIRNNTLLRDCLPSLGTRLWQDARSGLAVKYSPYELKGIDKILRGGRRVYQRSEWIERLSILRDQDDFVAMLQDQDWEGILENLYKVGVVFYEATESGYKNFYFRGDAMPTFSSEFKVGIHRTLWNELSLV